MRPTSFTGFPLAFAFLALILLTGCPGKRPVTVQGRVNYPANVKLAETDNIEVRFIGEGPAKSAAASASGKDPSFSTKTILPGKYKVAVKVVPYAGMPESEKRSKALEPLNKSFDESSTPLSIEIGTEPQQTITIDLGKKSVSKN